LNQTRKIFTLTSSGGDYSKAIGLDPEYAGAYQNRGNVYKKIGRTALATKDFDRVINLK